MVYGNTRSGLGHQNNSRGGVGQGAKQITTAKSGRDRTYIPQGQRASKIGGRQGAEERQQATAMIPALSFPHLFETGVKRLCVHDIMTDKDFFVERGLFPPMSGANGLVRSLKVMSAEDGHPLKSLLTTEIVIELKFLTDHTLPLDRTLSEETKTVIEYLRTYIVTVSGHIPKGKRR